MNFMTNIDLEKDPDAQLYLKDEVVTVAFASQDGEIASREGANRYAVGDALITGSTGDSWSVSRQRFDEKYVAMPPLMHGHPGLYRNRPVPVRAKRIDYEFSVLRSAGGDIIHGKAGDWLMQYAPGDFGIVEGKKFEMVYRRIEPNSN